MRDSITERILASALNVGKHSEGARPFSGTREHTLKSKLWKQNERGPLFSRLTLKNMHERYVSSDVTFLVNKTEFFERIDEYKTFQSSFNSVINSWRLCWMIVNVASGMIKPIPNRIVHTQ
jgi:hypothetical protein